MGLGKGLTPARCLHPETSQQSAVFAYVEKIHSFNIKSYSYHML